MKAAALPDGLLLSWYGDDFTGSAAVMEALTFGGVPSVLFLRAPTREQLVRFPEARAIGIAGTARAQTPHGMRDELPPLFEALAALQAPVFHYKICSTFDSSPEIGSIGAAVEMALPSFGGSWHPMLVAAPPIRRYQAFGTLFAAVGGVVHRLDRHPVMSRHPVTPMPEADLRLHLAQQTRRRLGLIDLLALRGDGGEGALAAAQAAGEEIIFLDTVDEQDLIAAGRLIWENRGQRLLAIGSQGVEYALLAYWRDAGLLPETQAAGSAGKVEPLLAVSGSVSPVTAGQLAWAEAHGFVVLKLDPVAALDSASARREIERLVGEALRWLGEGRSVVVCSARGPDDPAVAEFQRAVAQGQGQSARANAAIGEALGTVLSRTLAETGLKRAVILGGDTSGYASQQLGIYAFTALAPTIPGAALLRAHSADPRHQQLELALKGGQMGSPDYLGWIRDGGGVRGSS